MVGNETIMTSSSTASAPPGFSGIHKQHLNVAQARLSDAFEVTSPAKETDGLEEGEFTTVVSKKVISVGPQHIVASCTHDGIHNTSTAVYAKTTITGRRQLWTDLNAIHAQYVRGPWVVFGDFNCVFGAHEKREGSPPNATSCREFQQMCTSCDLIDIPTKGLAFTWTNQRVEERLDRALGNQEWLDSWVTMDCCTLTRATSDHCPILLTCSRIQQVFRPPFRFQSFWMQQPKFLSVVGDFWASLHFSGCPQFVLASKLRALKERLKDWSRVTTGNVHVRVKESKVLLDAVQSEISDMGLSEERFLREDVAQSRFLNDLSMQATFLKDQSRIRWLKDGDKNTSFLHNMVKLRRINKSICSLTVNDEIITDMSAIETHVVQHFEKAFTSDSSIVNTCLVERLIPCMVSEEENSDLLALPSYQEIHDTVMCMDDFSAPGPDGFNGSFYKFCWPIVDSDVVMVVRSFFENGYIMPHFNSNVITLIPKLQEYERVSDYRPIALANFSFKIITKILADRLGRVAAKIVSPNQSAFIAGRTILDPITQTSECVNLFNNSCKYGNVAIKFDISKAFDTLDWCFLLRVLEAFGFHPTFTRMLKMLELNPCVWHLELYHTLWAYWTFKRGPTATTQYALMFGNNVVLPLEVHVASLLVQEP
ncbi:hypothetical protein ACLB2K_008254 [Fragaria x ananassa]